MSDGGKFLRPDAIIEPLVDSFLAWLHTVTPVQSAMNLAFTQIPLLQSYLRSPQVHINAKRRGPGSARRHQAGQGGDTGLRPWPWPKPRDWCGTVTAGKRDTIDDQ